MSQKTGKHSHSPIFASAPLTAEIDLVLSNKPHRPAIASMKLHKKKEFLHLVQSSISADEYDQALAHDHLKAFLRKYFSGEDAHTRASCVEFLLRSCPASSIDGFRLQRSQSLSLVCDALRERMPSLLISTDEPQGGHVDALVAVDAYTFYIRGWHRDRESSLRSIVAISPEGERVRIDPSLVWHARADIDAFYGNTRQRGRSGFLCAFKTKHPSLLAEGWIIEIASSAGARLELKAPPATQDLVAVRSQLLSDLIFVPANDDDVIASHFSPAIESIQAEIAHKASIVTIEQFGVPPTSPDVSIIVPLYKRLDYLEHQLAQFVHDRELSQAQTLYVLDSPEDANALRERAGKLHELFRIPFSIVILSQNSGFSLANNLAASQASGRKLLLLNSDVLPTRPSWLSRMAAFYDQTPRIGALGPKLLYEDDSLQHAGMYFAKHNGAATWENMHYAKGLHHTLPAANVARRVPAVTGACLMIDRNLFSEIGGLNSRYVQGDYEDSDLCLRLTESGRENWYLPDVQLYHLEGGSYPDELRRLTTRYNRWLHTRRWDRLIGQVMSGMG